MERKTVEVRSVRLGEGRPKICVPIVAESGEELRQVLDTARLSRNEFDLVEYRADYLFHHFRPAEDSSAISRALSSVRRAVGDDVPVLFTVRTSREGGRFEGSFEEYEAVSMAAANSGLADLIDVELFAAAGSEEEYRIFSTDADRFARSEAFQKIRELGEKMLSADMASVFSSHDFQKTPSEEVMIRRLCAMQEAGAGIIKLAVMPKTREDVIALMSASLTMYEKFADRPLITMSMGPLGQISRLAGDIDGSCLTFGTIGKTSAPGQMEASFLRRYLESRESR